jgi:hypothetical protein
MQACGRIALARAEPPAPGGEPTRTDHGELHVIDRHQLEAALATADAPELLSLAGELQGRAWASLTSRTSAQRDPRMITS